MKSKIKRFLIWFMIFTFNNGMPIQAAEKKDGEQGFLYEDGDIVGFIGDSITHGEYTAVNYMEFLYQYYVSHFPEKRIEFRNLGTAGFTIQNVLDIYDWDPGFRGINKAVILLGMNEAMQKISPEEYISNMELLITRLKTEGLQGEDIMLLAPTPYDQTCALNYDKNGYPYQRTDDRLTVFTEGLAVKAQDWGVHYVDLHTPMKELSTELQKEDPQYTLTRGDCIHPDSVGQLLMAYYILQAQGAETELSEAAVLEPSEAVSKSFESFYQGERGLRFIWKPERLPFCGAEELQELPGLIPEAEAFVQEVFRREGLLEETSYELSIDDWELGSFTGRELAEGIDLAEQRNNPLRKTMEQIDEKSRICHRQAAEYRAAVYEAWETGTEAAQERLRGEVWEKWQRTDCELREEMRAQAQKALEQAYTVSIVEEGYSREELEREAEEAEIRARRLAREQAEKRAEEEVRSAGKAKEKKRLSYILAGAAAVTGALVLAVIRRGLRSRKKKIKNKNI